MKKPIIGLVPLWDMDKKIAWMRPTYLNAIAAAGGVAITLLLTEDAQAIARLCDVCDGILFTGGPDIHPRYYGEDVHLACGAICPERDAMEQQLFQEAVERRGMPVLGICRGMQNLNVFAGGSLYQDIPSEKAREKALNHDQEQYGDLPTHSVKLVREEALYRLLGVEAIMVNSFHHQGIKRLSRRLVAQAHSEDGLIEAFSMPEKPFVWGVQWHPEFMPEDEYARALFRAFVEACA